jgi:hypothetical protein
MTRPFLIGALALSTCLAAAPALAAKAKSKPAPAAQAAPDCPRASYKGDPVCFGWDASTELPTPSANAIPREKSDDVRINEDVTVSGADPKVMKKTPVDQYLNNPNPNPRKQDVSGGAAVNYKF